MDEVDDMRNSVVRCGGVVRCEWALETLSTLSFHHAPRARTLDGQLPAAYNGRTRAVLVPARVLAAIGRARGCPSVPVAREKPVVERHSGRREYGLGGCTLPVTRLRVNISQAACEQAAASSRAPLGWADHTTSAPATGSRLRRSALLAREEGCRLGETDVERFRADEGSHQEDTATCTPTAWLRPKLPAQAG
ncbi:hypothetical protein JB92DRAFT_3109547 [Gautieria morchelliformis]|nr:hypothetical protein JB92DRAFT_3109547 [Gautieria morchelliformis]